MAETAKGHDIVPLHFSERTGKHKANGDSTNGD
jgi:hypothetical protein